MTSLLIANQAADTVQRNPAGRYAMAGLFIALALLIIFAIYKVFKGLSYTTDLIGDLAPSTTEQKEKVVSSSTYQDGIKWLDSRTGIVAVTKSKYKNPSAYMAAKGLSYDQFGRVATEIWDAKLPFYISTTEVYKAIASLPSKAAISLMAGVFDQYYSGLWNGGTLSWFLGKYLKLDEMKGLTNIINTKPEL